MRGQLDLFLHGLRPEPVKVERVALVACGKTKKATAAPAGELYTGPLVQLAWLKAALEEMDEEPAL